MSVAVELTPKLAAVAIAGCVVALTRWYLYSRAEPDADADGDEAVVSNVQLARGTREEVMAMMADREPTGVEEVDADRMRLSYLTLPDGSIVAQLPVGDPRVNARMTNNPGVEFLTTITQGAEVSLEQPLLYPQLETSADGQAFVSMRAGSTLSSNLAAPGPPSRGRLEPVDATCPHELSLNVRFVDEQNGCRLWNPRCYPELLDDSGCVVVAVLWLDSVFLPPRDFAPLPEGTPAGQWLKHHASQNSFGLGTRTIVMTTTFGLFTGIIPPSDE